MNDRVNHRDSGQSTESLPKGISTAPLGLAEWSGQRKALAVAACVLLASVALYLAMRTSPQPPAAKAAVEDEHSDEHGDEGGEVELSAEALAAAKIEIESVTERAVVALSVRRAPSSPMPSRLSR